MSLLFSPSDKFVVSLNHAFLLLLLHFICMLVKYVNLLAAIILFHCCILLSHL